MGLCIRMNSLTKNVVSYNICVFVPATREIPAKSARYVHLVQNHWCSEFITYVYAY